MKLHSKGRKIEILVTWINNSVEMAANTQETILLTFQMYFCQMYKDLMFQTFGFLPYMCLLSEDILQYLLLYSHHNSTSSWSLFPFWSSFWRNRKQSLLQPGRHRAWARNLTYVGFHSSSLSLTKYVTLGNCRSSLSLRFLTCKKLVTVSRAWVTHFQRTKNGGAPLEMREVWILQFLTGAFRNRRSPEVPFMYNTPHRYSEEHKTSSVITYLLSRCSQKPRLIKM